MSFKMDFLPQTPVQSVVFAALVVTALTNLAANLVGQPLGRLTFLSKVLLMPLLAMLLFLCTRGTRSAIPLPSIFAALFLCWLGDVFLALPYDSTFIWGVGAFGLAHLFYIRALLKGVSLKQLRFTQVAVRVLPFLVYSYTLYSILYINMDGHNEKYRLPLAIYMLLLMSSAIFSALRTSLIRTPSSAAIFVGVVLFVQSDTIIAIARFVDTLPLESFSIMATYIVGQYLIVSGCVQQARAVGRAPQAPAATVLASA